MPDSPVLQRLIKTVTGATTLFALMSMLSMMLLITLDVILNKLIGRPIPGTIEVTSYYFMVLVVFLGLPHLERTQAHISADFIVVQFSNRWQTVMMVVGKLLTAAFYSLLAYGALMQAIKSTKRLEAAMSNFTFYIWPARWGVFIGLVSAILIIVLILFLGNNDKYPENE